MEKYERNNEICKVNSFDLLEEIILFEDRISILTESMRHSVIDSKIFNFSQYNYELSSLLDLHKKRLLQLKLHKSGNIYYDTTQIRRMREN